MDKPAYRAYICCGPNCGPRGSRALLDYLEDEVERFGLGVRVSVSPTACQSHCKTGPTMIVYPGPISYQEISEERLDRIVAEHFIRGEPVKEYFWTGPRERIIPGTRASALPVPPGKPFAASHRDHYARPRSPRPNAEVDDFKW